MATVTTAGRRGFAGWNTRDMLVTAVLGLVCGALIVPMVYAYTFLLGLGPLILWATTGVYFFPAFFIAYCIRRPGAALLGMLLVGLVQLPFTPAGAAFLVSALLRGVLTEPLVAAVTRYRTFDLSRMVLLGALAGLLFFLIFGLVLGTARFDIILQLAVAGAATVSCVVGALLAKSLADAIARTGVLSGTALGRTHASEEV